MLCQSPQPLRPWQAVRTMAAVSSLLAALGTARAEVPDAGALQQMARDFVQPALNQALPAGATGPLRPEVVIGQLDSRLRLAPCNRIEPHLPPGTRLWGRSRIGLRCVQGPTPWSVFLPITVKAWGPAWTVRQTLTPGTVLTRDMAEATEVDWAEGVSPVLPTEEQWVGSETVRAIMPGQVLRQNMVRQPQMFSAGAQVKVVASGKGFALNANGEAVGHGYLGQNVRVRMASGRVISGVVRSADTVEIQI